jgi:selenocysteine lyase/cysteine desulfurase
MQRQHVALELLPTDAAGFPDEAGMLDRLGRGDVSILAISSVQFTNGYRADLDSLGEACRRAGAFLVVDAIQSAGALEIDVSRTAIDVLATGGHKWLCAPFGAGFTYVRREVQEQLEPADIGWGSMQACQDLAALIDYEWELLPDARRYEVATPAFQDYVGLAASLELLLEVGVTNIEAHNESLLRPFHAWLAEHPEVTSLSPSSPERRSGIVSIRPPDLAGTVAALRSAGVICSIREGGVRIAAHFYNTERDVGRLIDVLDSQLGGAGR